MAYQALYRVYRPKTFDEMVGQTVITKTLENAIEKGQTGHAYLFSGPRGTGKTSAAKIFARAVNGIGPEQANDAHPDIIEIDAASNNGVDEIRSIRDSANYAPIEAPFKIYIIDEAHMLSTGAFNALLKTLEEPPAQVKFILATTEVQKMPATILSRTQRFEFKRLSNKTIKQRLIEILQIEDDDFEDQALDVVATAAEGGMRDALSILDQVIAYGPEKITLDNALTVIGSVKIDQLLTYLNQVVAGDTAAALATLTDILLAGKDANRFLADLMATLRDVMLVDLAPDLIKATSKVADLKAFRQAISQSQIQQMLVVIDDIKKQIMASLQSDIYLELLTVKLSAKEAGEKTPVAKQGHDSIIPQVGQKEAQPAVDKKKVTISVTAPQEQGQSLNSHQVDLAPSQELQQELVENSSAKDDQGDPVPVDLSGQVEPDKQGPASPVNHADMGQEKLVEKTVSLPTIYTGQEAVQAVLSQAKRDQLTQAQHVWPTLVKDFSVKDQAVLQTVSPMAASEQALILAFDFPAIMSASLKKTDLLQQLGQRLREENLPEMLVFRTKDEWQNDRSAYVQTLRSGQKVDLSLTDLQPVVVTTSDQTKQDQQGKLSEKNDAQPDLVQEAKDLFGADMVVVTERDDEGK